MAGDGNKGKEDDPNSAVAMLPIRLTSTVVRGFRRGSSDLGIPTANLNCHFQQAGSQQEHDQKEDLPAAWSVQQQRAPSLSDLPNGIYWGYGRIIASGKDAVEEAYCVHTAAISIGYNPTYGNDHKTIEPHLIAKDSDPRRRASSCGETVFQDFYDRPIRLSVCGYLRPELPFEGIEKLAQAIKEDIAKAVRLGEGHDSVEENGVKSKQEYAWVAGNDSVSGVV